MEDQRFAEHQILMKTLKAQHKIFQKVLNSTGFLSLRHS